MTQAAETPPENIVAETTTQIRSQIQNQLERDMAERERMDKLIAYFRSQLDMATQTAIKLEGSIETGRASLAMIEKILTPEPAPDEASKEEPKE